MTDHPITPPPELVQEWREEAAHRQYSVSETEDYLIEQAAQYSADQELEACCEWIPKATPWDAEQLRASRRPKPPSEKQQALEDLDGLEADLAKYGMGFKTTNIRRALESIPDPS
jgi:hypothetical protein